MRLEEHPECMEAVVAFTDIKAASQAYNEDQLLGGAAPLSIAFCDAAGSTQSEPRFAQPPPALQVESPSAKPDLKAVEDVTKANIDVDVKESG